MIIIHLLHIQNAVYPLVAYPECCLSTCCISRMLFITCCISRKLFTHLLHIQKNGYPLAAYPQSWLSTCCISRMLFIHLLHIQNAGYPLVAYARIVSLCSGADGQMLHDFVSKCDTKTQRIVFIDHCQTRMCHRPGSGGWGGKC